MTSFGKDNSVRLGTRAKRILWLCFEIGIALLVVGLCYFLAVEKPPFLFPIKWLGLAMSTLNSFWLPHQMAARPSGKR